jgi:ABC-type branched-subunit amino acid transport system substrate-binding protein
MTLETEIRAIADQAADDLEARLEVKLEAVRQDLRNAVAGITGEAAIQVANAGIKGVVGPALEQALAPAIAALQAKVDPKAVADALLAMDETDEHRAAYGLPVTFANRLQNYVTYALTGLLTNEDFLREWVAALDRATAPETP